MSNKLVEYPLSETNENHLAYKENGALKRRCTGSEIEHVCEVRGDEMPRLIEEYDFCPQCLRYLTKITV